MKLKLLTAISAFVILAILCASCASKTKVDETQEPDLPTAPLTTTESPTSEPPTGENPNGGTPDDGLPLQGNDRSIRHDLSYLIDIEWPESVVYKPEFRVFPLVSTGQVYKTGITGALVFVDTSLGPVTLPIQPRSYATVGDIAYAIFLQENHPEFEDWPTAVLMLADGTIPRSADGKLINLYDFYENSYLNIGSAVVTYRTVPSPYGDGTLPLLGLYDVDAQAEILPCDYDWLEIIGGSACFAHKDGNIWLFDSKGRELFTFPASTETIDTPTTWGYNSSYYLDVEQRVFYLYSDLNETGGFDYLEKWQGFYIARAGEGTSNRLMYVLDVEGYEIFNTNYQSFTTSYAALVITTNEGLFISIDTDGTISTIEEDPIRNDRHLEGPLYYDYDDTALYSIRDKDNNVILETTDYLMLSGSFIVRLQPVDGNDMRNDPKIIYDHSGNILLDDIYGCIYEAPAPGGGMFVYLSPDDCVLLHPDGRTEPVPNAPSVQQVYWGG